MDFAPRIGDEWSCEEVATVTLAPGADRERDLLFTDPRRWCVARPAGCFRRVRGKE
jgi:hypothetical protein